MAQRWYKMAADLGDRDARQILKRLGRVPNNALQVPVHASRPLQNAQGARRTARR
jgi:TPR repeat protein